jgi:hypothetical protein
MMGSMPGLHLLLPGGYRDLGGTYTPRRRNVPNDPNELLGVQQVAELLGVDRTTVPRLPIEPAERTGGGDHRKGRRKYRRRDVEAFRDLRDSTRKRETPLAIQIVRLQSEVIGLRSEVAELRAENSVLRMRLDTHIAAGHA